MKVKVNIALSVLLVLSILLGLNKVYKIGLRNNVNLKASYVQKANIDADILIQGPCEPLWMISPLQLDSVTGLKSYNLALSHSDFADNYLHLYFYLKHNKAPKAMLLYVTPESMDLKYNTFNTYRFAAFVNDSVVYSVVKECDQGYANWLRVPFMRYAYYSSKINFDVLQGYKHWMNNRVTPYHADGFEPPLQVVWDNHLEEFIQLYPQGYAFEWSALREKYLRKTIELAKEKGIRVYLYESPVLEEAIPYQPNRASIIAKLDKLAQEYGIDYVRFEHLEMAKSRTYFMSTLNTNTKGSRIFTDTLGKYIKKEMKFAYE